MKRVLMVAFHFPPHHGSSGIQRTLRFVQNLPDFGWEPIVLAPHPRAYERRLEESVSEIPADIPVIRSQAWNTANHLAIANRYPDFLARPDKWVSWWPAACLDGMRAVRRYQPDILWSTYPIATAHLIGRTLARHTRLPWIADFRDPMAQESYPRNLALRRQYWKLEASFVRLAALTTLTTPGAVSTYRARYPAEANRICLLENGYDEASFPAAAGSEPLRAGRITLLHSGVVYPSERDPTQLFEALGLLRCEAPDVAARLIIRFRASGQDELLRSLAQRFSVSDLVETAPPMPYRDALTEMLRADGLLVMQASNCNDQIPAKVYEYMRAGRPIIGLTDSAGDTASALRAAGISALTALNDAHAIASLLKRFAEDPGSFACPSLSHARAQSRRERTRQLAQFLDGLRRPA